MATLATNPRAKFDYQLEDSILAGMVLESSEVKSLRNRQASIKGAFCAFRGGELWLMGGFISIYSYAQINHDPNRDRKLLVTKKQLQNLRAAKQQGRSIIPTKIMTKGAFIKIEIATARAKKKHDKRAALREKDDSRRAKITTKNQSLI